MDLSEHPDTPPIDAAPVSAVLRAVLLCDIVESTALVERLGDVGAVALLKRHDQLLRQLMEQCQGQLIDKADGVLALFERPIRALDFALRYQRGLRELGAMEGLDLKARIGMHVGDVMTWANAPRDVLLGAKAFEVEGLAKPVAARLMNLALPGQILMSGMAQNLCHRAMAELGDAGSRLRWQMHGRYRFKGVPAAMLVHEVGEPGLSPLRAPDSNAKAWRDLPIWRRPPILALEILVVAVLAAVGFGVAMRSPPAIAFSERDWVVLADLQNQTSEKIFDQSLDTALRVGLEQSRHVNLISELQIDRALERMQRQGQFVSRELASELALREGAKAVILPTLAEVGGVVRVSLEVVDPGSGATVYSESADTTASGGVLPALDIALAKVRGRLGEAVDSIEQTSAPLEQVTTGNIEALRAYSLGLRARYESRLDDAQALFEQATKLDPQFATAYVLLAFMRYVENDADGTRRYLALAEANRTHLNQREALFLDGASASLDAPALALQRFKLLATLYPDEFRAHSNYAYFAHNDMMRSEAALAMIGPALAPQNARRGTSHYLAGAINLALNRYAQAEEQFELAESLGIGGFRREHIEMFAAQRQYAQAEREMAKQSSSGSVATEIEARLIEITLPIDRGRYDEALAAAYALEQAARAPGVAELNLWHQQGITLSLRSLAPDEGFAADLAAYGQAQSARAEGADSLLRRHLLFQILSAAWMAAHTGDPALAQRLLDSVAGDPLVAAYPANAAMRRCAEAEMALGAGNADAAIALLADKVDTVQGSYFEHAVLMRAHLAAGHWDRAASYATWLAANRGRAFAETTSLGHWQPMNVAESSMALRVIADDHRRRGRSLEAAEAQAAFEAAWPNPDRLAPIRRRFRAG